MHGEQRARGRARAAGSIVGLLALLLIGAVPVAALPLQTGSDGGDPPIGVDPVTEDLRSLDHERLADGSRAIPLRAAQPDWLTDELLAEVRASDEPVAAPPDAPLPSWVGIRPGSWMIAPYGCTMNFIYERNGDLAIGTAGHCVDETGQSVVLLTVAPGEDDPVLIEIGPVISLTDQGIGADFALVDIPERYYEWVSPTIALVGGPCGEYPGGLDTVAHYGHGVAIGTGGTPRAGVATHWEPDAYGWAGAALFGDSGSAVRVTDLRAAGNLTHLVVDPAWLPSYIAGTTIQRMLSLAGSYDLALSEHCPLTANASDSGDGTRNGHGRPGEGDHPSDRRNASADGRNGAAATIVVDGWAVRLGVGPAA